MTNPTTTLLLDAAQDLIQHRSYNAFSYKDLAKIVGIRTASIHYHFPAKADLGVAVMQRYLEQLQDAVAEIEGSESTAEAKLRRFVEVYRTTETNGAICLCGSLASDQETLPEELQKAISKYLDFSQAWVTEKISEGMAAGEFHCVGEPSEAAATLLSGLQGGLILSRARGDQAPILQTVERVFFQSLEPSR